MSADIILTSVATFIAGGGLGALINLKSSKKKGEVEVKVDEIGALHDIIEKVYEPTIRFQKGRIEELESEVKSLKEQLSIERSDRQRDMEMMNKRILAITSALGIKAATQLRDKRGRYKKEGETDVEEK